MLKLARISVKRPKLALAAWSVVAVVLVLIGFGVSHSLSPSVTVVPGTQSSSAQQLANAQVRAEPARADPAPGPEGAARQAGPRAGARADQAPRTRVMSAWDGGAVSGPAAQVADRGDDRAVGRPQRELRRSALGAADRGDRLRYISSPVKAYVTGQPSIDRAEKNASLANLRRNELIARRDPVPAAADRVARPESRPWSSPPWARSARLPPSAKSRCWERC